MNGSKNRRAAGLVLTCLLAVAICSCSSRADSTADGALDFTLVNLTGKTLHAIYVSPHDSPGWEENILARGKLPDGEHVLNRFSPDERASTWDLRVEDKYGNNTEWKNLDLRAISKITLRLGGGKDVVIAEAE